MATADKVVTAIAKAGTWFHSTTYENTTSMAHAGVSQLMRKAFGSTTHWTDVKPMRLASAN
jgi:hypothetical protein